MDTLQNFKKIDPRRAGYLQFALRAMIVLQVLGYFLIFFGVLGPNMPGENGFFASMAKRLVKPSKFDQLHEKFNKIDLQEKVSRKAGISKAEAGLALKVIQEEFNLSLEKKRNLISMHSLFGSFYKDLVKLTKQILSVSVAMSLRLAAVSTGLIIILSGGWIRRRIRNWLIRLKMKTTEEKIEILEKRIIELEKK